MSSSKQPQSGLKSLTRNWSESEPPSSQPINWPPTPPKPSAPKKLSGAEQRLKDIQDALAGNDVPSEGARSGKPPSRGTALTSTSAFNKKRPSEATDDGAASKKRQLPSSWNDPEPVKAARVTRPSASSSVTVASRPKVKGSGKPAAVFLSQEQTQILKLVQEGNSVFYTGSAGTGKSVLLREIIKTLRKKYVKSPDAVAITASTGNLSLYPHCYAQD
ncbi:hypothetical protein PLICRDRAFT_113165 [Plicaturopsis crispa FD-325 SS-3]|nr:hypothetical protein PLICRDRAFT_113165 [Plicaturopsis crispa FD-325 SS-3]